MTISFDIPANVRVPKAYFDIDPQNPVGGGSLNRMLIVGARNNTATDDAPNNRPIAVSSNSQVETAFGRGSQLALMVQAALAVAPQVNLWAMAAPVSTPTARTVAFTLALEGAATTTGGDVFVDINDQTYTISLSAEGGGSNLDAAGNAIAAQISADTSIPYSAAYDTASDTLTFTARTGGELANADTIALTSRGTNFATSSFTATNTAGAGSFEVDRTDTDAIQSAVTTDEQFDMVVIPSALDDTGGTIDTTNTTVLNAFEDEMERRWGATSNAYGHILTSFKGSVTQVNTLMNTRNNQYETIVCYEPNSPTPEYIVSAVYGARVFGSLVADPARPATGLSLRGVDQAPNPQDSFTEANRNAILNDGGATIRYIQGEAEIERATTTRRNTGNADDFNWFDIQTPFTVVVCARSINNFISSRFSRSKLSDTPPTLAGDVITVDIIRNELLGLYGTLVDQGLCDGPVAFEADPNFVVQRATNDPTVVEIAMPLRLVNQARVFKIKLNFQL